MLHNTWFDRERLATPNLLHIHAGEINCDPAARDGCLFLFLVGLEAADAGVQTGWQDFQFIAYCQPPVRECAGNDGPKAGDGKDPINWQARATQIGAGRQLLQEAVQGLQEFRKTCPGERRNAQDRGRL